MYRLVGCCRGADSRVTYACTEKIINGGTVSSFTVPSPRAGLPFIDSRAQRAILGKVRRLSRPFLRAMALSLAALLAARLFLGDLLAARIDPTIELLFSDDVVNT